MYEKLHRWSDEDQAVGVLDTDETADTESTLDQDSYVIDYRTRIESDDD